MIDRPSASTPTCWPVGPAKNRPKPAKTGHSFPTHVTNRVESIAHREDAKTRRREDAKTRRREDAKTRRREERKRGQTMNEKQVKIEPIAVSRTSRFMRCPPLTPVAHVPQTLGTSTRLRTRPAASVGLGIRTPGRVH